MKPQDAFSPETWKKKTPEEKLEILKDDFVYSLLEIFVYEENDLFPRYTIRQQGVNVSIRYYMIDLRNAYRIDCDKIIAPEKSYTRKIAEDFLGMAQAYYNDAQHFQKQNDLMRALACVNYAHGWLDAGARLGIFEVGADDRLFTLAE